MNIVFYTPVNFVCRDVTSLLHKFKNDGHNVMLLSQVQRGTLHNELEKFSIPTFVSSVPAGRLKIPRQFVELIRFCKSVKADILFSHLEPTNFVSVIAQFLIHARVVIFRHHLDLAQLSDFGNSWSYQLTYKLARTVVTVSAISRRYMIDVEKIDANKIHHINLGYDFGLFPEIPNHSVEAIRRNHNADILLLTVGRLDKFKRPEVSLQTLKILRDQFHIDAKLIFLGQGELLESLKSWASENGISDYVTFPGFVPNVMSYMAAADFLIHPSISESSSVAIKEAALVNLPVLVCKNVGDFGEFIVHKQNGFLLNAVTMAEESAALIAEFAKHPGQLDEIAQRLKDEIRQRFNIDNTYSHFKQFLT
jgi:glycosyltransferase involved in cell wall biosynthesis